MRWSKQGKRLAGTDHARAEEMKVCPCYTDSSIMTCNEFEDAQEQAPTQVQWHDAELTVKWHLTDRLFSPKRTYCVLGYLLLEPH